MSASALQSQLDAKTPEALSLPELPGTSALTVQEYAYRRLHHALMVGSIAPGVPLTIRGLAQALGISPTPVREALRRLSSKNALQVLENRRIIVPKMTAAKFDELVSTRCALEVFAAERAFPHISDFLIDQLEALDFEMDDAIARGDRADLICLNQKFHSRFYAANAHQVCLPMIENIWLQLGPFMQVALRHLGRFYTVDRHKEIIAALRQRDLSAVKQALRADIYDPVGHLDKDAIAKILGT